MRQNRPFPPVPPPSEPVNPAPISRPVRLKHAVGRNFTRFHSVILVILAVVLSVSGMYIYDSRKPAPQRLTQKDIDAAVGRVLETATPKPYYASMAYAGIYQAIVRINATSRASGGKTENSQGTGVVIDDTGLILTSLHVVKDSSKLIVVFYDGMECQPCFGKTCRYGHYNCLKAITPGKVFKGIKI